MIRKVHEIDPLTCRQGGGRTRAVGFFPGNFFVQATFITEIPYISVWEVERENPNP
jgi:hypothetical protein